MYQEIWELKKQEIYSLNYTLDMISYHVQISIVVIRVEYPIHKQCIIIIMIHIYNLHV
jgi:hypothetical protein